LKEEKKYHGVVIPMITPFTEGGKIDELAATRIVEYLLKEEMYLFLLGTTGESASMPPELKLQFVKYVLSNIKRETIVYVGIADNCLENSIDLANKYSDLGADVFVAHLPSYYPLTQNHMLNYYEALAENSPRPIIIYNIPGTTNMSIPLDVIDKLSRHPNIVGLKDSERDLGRLKQSAEMFGERPDFSILCGWTAQSANILMSGYDGIVPSTGNVVPEMFGKLYKAAVSCDDETAGKLQAEINGIADIHQTVSSLSVSIAQLKVMMSELGMCEQWVLPPLMTLSLKERDQIKEKMNDLAKRSS